MIFTVPTFLAVTFPVLLSTAATAVLEDEYVTVPFAPVVETVAVLPTETVVRDDFAAIDCAAFRFLELRRNHDGRETSELFLR